MTVSFQSSRLTLLKEKRQGERERDEKVIGCPVSFAETLQERKGEGGLCVTSIVKFIREMLPMQRAYGEHKKRLILWSLLSLS